MLPMPLYRGFNYRGPRSTLVQEMIQNKLFEMAKDSPFDYEKPKFDKKDKDLLLGTLKISSLLAWASAARDHDIVTCMLQHKEDFVSRVVTQSGRSLGGSPGLTHSGMLHTKGMLKLFRSS